MSFSLGCTQLKVLSGVIAGTPEAGGWTSREVKRIIRGLAGLNFVFVSRKAPLFHDFTLLFTVVRTLSKLRLRMTMVGRMSFHPDNF